MLVYQKFILKLLLLRESNETISTINLETLVRIPHWNLDSVKRFHIRATQKNGDCSMTKLYKTISKIREYIEIFAKVVYPFFKL